MKVYIANDGTSFTDYTQYVLEESLTIEDSINVPTVVSFGLMASSNAFNVPKRAGYVKIVSETYGASGYLAPGQDPLTYGKVLATGFITNEPERDYAGLNPRLSKFGFQQLHYQINVTSDEWLLNTKVIPFVPAFINQTQGQILARLAQALRPEFAIDVTSHVASGDVVPYFEYTSDKTWSDVAKTFADASRYRYKVLNKVLYYEPFNDQPLGVSYDETHPQIEGSFFPLDIKTLVLTTPPVNDAIVLGDTEAQTKWDSYFIGDGFSATFRLHHKVFRGDQSSLLSEDWTGTSFDSNWIVEDPLFVFSLNGALDINQDGLPSVLGTEYILSKNGIELGGHLCLQHGEFFFTDTCQGIVGGIYVNTTLTLDNCIAGFGLSPSGTMVVSASGAAGVIIQPIFNGQPVGPQVVSQANHHYQLATWIGGDNWARYQAAYRTLTGEVQYGGLQLTSNADVTFTITDIDLAQVVADQYAALLAGGGLAGAPLPPPQVVTKFTLRQVSLPSFAAYAPINAENLNLTLNYTLVATPPQGELLVQALSGASGGLQPVLPSRLGEEINYLLGFGLQNQTATIQQSDASSQLAFYDDSIPGVGARIRFISWEEGQAMARVQDPIAIANEAVVSGDDGHRSAILTSMRPQPRTSDEAELAAAAAIKDREYPQFQGTYTVYTIPYKFEGSLNPSKTDYPRTGRMLFVNAPVRAISGQKFFVHTVRCQVVELREEVLQFEVSYGPDQYLEKLLSKFVERPEQILTPKETAKPPSPVQIANAGSAYVPMFASASCTAIVESLSGNYIEIDLGAPPVTAAEVRRVDSGWGTNDQNLVGLFTTQKFKLPRPAHDQTFYIRPRYGSKTSRFSYAVRVAHPFIPGQPFPRSLDISNGLAPVVTFDFPQQGQIPGVTSLAFNLWQSNTGAIRAAFRESGIVYVQFFAGNGPPFGFAQYIGRNVILENMPDPSFNGVFTIATAPPMLTRSSFPMFGVIQHGADTGELLADSTARVSIISDYGMQTDDQYDVNNQNTYVSDVYGLEIRGPDDKTVILQRVVTAASDLIVTFNPAQVTGIIVAGVLSATGGYFISIHPYFYNLKWGYSKGYKLTFDPQTSGCCADCVDPLEFNAVGDGLTDDTAAVQQALDIAGWNAGNKTLFGGQPPLTRNATLRKGTVVCLKSGYLFRVAPSAMDNFPVSAGNGFGPLAPALRIDSGVTLQLDGQLLLDVPQSGIPDTSNLVLLENRNADTGGRDTDIVIRGSGVMNVTAPPLSGIQITYITGTADAIAIDDTAGGEAFFHNHTTNGFGIISKATNSVLSDQASPFSDAPTGFQAWGGGMAVGDNEQLYITLAGASNYGLAAGLTAGLGLGSIGGSSGKCSGSGIPNYCVDPSYAICPSRSGRLVPFSFQGNDYIMMISSINASLWVDCPVFQIIAGALTCVGYMTYTLAGIANVRVPNGCADNTGHMYVINTNAANSLTQISRSGLLDTKTYCSSGGGSSITFTGAPGGGGGGSIVGTQVGIPPGPGRWTPTVFDISSAHIFTGSVYIKWCASDNTLLCAGSGDVNIVKVDAVTGAVISTTAFSGMLPDDGFPGQTTPDGLFAVRTTDGFQIIDGTTMTVVQSIDSVSVITDGSHFIAPGQVAQTLYDPASDSIWVRQGFSVFRLAMNIVLVPPNVGRVGLRLNQADRSVVEGITIKNWSLGAMYLGSQESSTVRETKLVPTQSGYGVILDRCSNAKVVDNVYQGGTNIDEEGGIGALFVEAACESSQWARNSATLLAGRFYSHQSYGFEDGVSVGADFPAGIRVSGNTCENGTGTGVPAIYIVGIGESGFTIEGNVVENNSQSGLVVGGISDATFTGNVIRANGGGGVSRGVGTLTNVAFVANIVSGNTNWDFAPITSGQSVFQNDGESTVVGWNPAVDPLVYMSMAGRLPTAEGSPYGQPGLVAPHYGPSKYYAIRLPGGSTYPITPVAQVGTTSTISISPFILEFPDKTIYYQGPKPSGTTGQSGWLTPTQDHGNAATYYVFVDDPYHDGQTDIVYGTCTDPADLVTSSGRYLIDVITMNPFGGAIGKAAGGNLPFGAGILTMGMIGLSQPYDIACTIIGLSNALVPGTPIVYLPMVRPIYFLPNFKGSRGRARTGAGASSVFPIKKTSGGVATQIGTMTWPSSDEAVFASTSTVIFQLAPNEILSVEIPAVPDGSLADFGFIIVGYRAFLSGQDQIGLSLGDSINNWQDQFLIGGSAAVVNSFAFADSINNWADAVQTGGTGIGTQLQQTVADQITTLTEAIRIGRGMAIAEQMLLPGTTSNYSAGNYGDGTYGGQTPGGLTLQDGTPVVTLVGSQYRIVIS